MASLSVNWAYVCVMTAWKRQNTVKNTGALLPAGNDVSVSTPAQIQNMAEPYMSNRGIIQGFLTYRQGTVRNGSWNTTNGLLLKDQINVKK